jgi:parvulin-like peptidyl-prolyl isomerase
VSWLLALALLGAANNDNPVMAIAGNDTLFRRDLQIELSIQGINDLSPENLQPMLDNWVDQILTSREAVRRGLGTDETTQAAIREYGRQYLVSLMTRQITDTVHISDNEIYDYFNRRRLDFVTRLRIAYMALPDEPTARRTAQDLATGKDFKQLANERSLDRATNPRAEATFNGRNDTTVNMDPALEDTVFTLPLGKVSPPIASGGAYWLIKPLERSYLRDTTSLPPVHDYIGKLLELKRKQAVMGLAIAALRKKARITQAVPRGDTTGFLVSVNGAVLTRHYLDLQITDKSQISNSDMSYLLDIWTKSELLYQEARRLGLGNDETTKVNLTDKRREFMTNLLLQREVGNITVPSTEVFDYFQQHKDEFLYDVRIMHILVGSESLAQALLSQINQGADFSTLARDRSYDRAANQGQESHYLDRLDSESGLSPTLEEVIFRLPAGGTSGILHSREGYWIVRVTDRRKVRNDVTFDQAQDRIAVFVRRLKQQQRLDALLGDLRRQYPVRLFPDNFWN